MLIKPRIFIRVILLFTTLFMVNAQAGNAILIWPIDPKINHDEKGTELWLENRGENTTMMQVRVFRWQQVNGQEQFQTQQEVMASPPMVRIEPGKKQLVRLIKQTPPGNGKEAAYRILLDEIPAPRQSSDNTMGVNFQMRYSVPLFVYGDGVTAESVKPALSWRLINHDGKQILQITNRGNGHARLSHVTLGGRILADSLLGYVLTDASGNFPVNFLVPAQAELSAELGNKQNWHSRSSR